MWRDLFCDVTCGMWRDLSCDITYGMWRDLSSAPQIEGPDIFAFSDPCDRSSETPYLTVDGLPPLTLCPRPRPPHTVFDMFQKLGEWTSS
ncbi:unnamed protein product [Ranitomeya imitator]|uniref:Protein phosphatase 1 regulatory subunit 35 C-terminal domain-containing protein n=1 Tax=Ranitomeya imitator TaxID=111125 RepID=A0ABN9LMD3_9NEOB|nr:unnamed protein product [Ranitomeya imitator]